MGGHVCICMDKVRDTQTAFIFVIKKRSIILARGHRFEKEYQSNTHRKDKL